MFSGGSFFVPLSDVNIIFSGHKSITLNWEWQWSFMAIQTLSGSSSLMKFCVWCQLTCEREKGRYFVKLRHYNKILYQAKKHSSKPPIMCTWMNSGTTPNINTAATKGRGSVLSSQAQYINSPVNTTLIIQPKKLKQKVTWSLTSFQYA